MESFIKDLFVPDYKLLLAIIGCVTAYFQWQKTRQEARGFRQQLITLLHHAEGVTSSIEAVKGGTFSTLEDMRTALEAAYQNSETLFFGLIETKVGGRAVKDDIDKKYAEWVDLELDRKKLPTKEFLYEQNLKPRVRPTLSSLIGVRERDK